jgi:hypothetical protein
MHQYEKEEEEAWDLRTRGKHIKCIMGNRGLEGGDLRTD